MLNQSSEICRLVQSRNHIITPEEVLGSELEHLLANGLQVLTICNDGSGRSLNAARSLTDQHGIPAVHLQGGLNRLVTDQNLNEHLHCLIYTINTVPVIPIILTRLEIFYYLNVLNQFRASKFSSSTSAVDGVLSRYT